MPDKMDPIKAAPIAGGLGYCIHWLLQIIRDWNNFRKHMTKGLTVKNGEYLKLVETNNLILERLDHLAMLWRASDSRIDSLERRMDERA